MNLSKLKYIAAFFFLHNIYDYSSNRKVTIKTLYILHKIMDLTVKMTTTPLSIENLLPSTPH